MKIFSVIFSPMYPVPSGLIIAANDIEQAENMAREIIKHTDSFSVIEVNVSKPCVIFYESGDY